VTVFFPLELGFFFFSFLFLSIWFPILFPSYGYLFHFSLSLLSLSFYLWFLFFKGFFLVSYVPFLSLWFSFPFLSTGVFLTAPHLTPNLGLTSINSERTRVTPGPLTELPGPWNGRGVGKKTTHVAKQKSSIGLADEKTIFCSFFLSFSDTSHTQKHLSVQKKNAKIYRHRKNVKNEKRVDW